MNRFKKLHNVCKKTTVSDAKISFSRLAKSENPQFTGVNEDFSDERNAENGVFAQRLHKKSKSRYRIAVFAFAMLVTLQQANAQFAGGNGTESNPYLISNAEEFDSVRNHSDSHFRLINDIDLAAYLAPGGPAYNAGKGWIPLAAFTGTFKGGGHAIKHLLINRPDEDTVGLFTSIHKATIDSLTLDSCMVTGKNYTGGLTGVVADSCIVSHFHINGSLTGASYIGMIAGIAEYATAGLIEFCTTSGTITHSTGMAMGGIIGQLRGENFTVSNCINYTDLTAPDGWPVGGITGRFYQGTIEYCENYGDILGGDGTDIGGIAGQVWTPWNAFSKINNCKNYGTIEGKHAGGIVGYNQPTEGTHELFECENYGDITGQNYTGGIAGWSRYTMSLCKNYGTVSGGINVTSYTGGIIGHGSVKTITNCHNFGVILGNHHQSGGIVGNTWGDSKIINCSNNAAVNGENYTGGILGFSADSVSIQRCFNNDTVSGNKYIGGIIGGMSDSRNTIYNCYNMGFVAGDSVTGGIAGENKGELENCYNIGDFTANIDSAHIAGLNTGNVSNCYCDTLKTGIGITPNGGNPKSTFRMALQSTFEGWDFDTTWAIDSNNTYPYLQWQADTFMIPLPQKYSLHLEVVPDTAGYFSVPHGTNQYCAGDSIIFTFTLNEHHFFDKYHTDSTNYEDTLFYHAMKDTAITAYCQSFRGDGSEQNPYLISTPLALDKMREYEGTEHAGTHFALANDIDMKDYLSENGRGYNNGKGWRPISVDWSSHPETEFVGNLHGQGFEIKNLVIGENYSPSGLFGVFSGNILEDFGITSCRIEEKNSWAGAVAGFVYTTNDSLYISNLYASGEIIGQTAYSGGGLFGGISGYVDTAIIRNCYSTVDLNGDFNSLGGLIGKVTMNRATLINCYSTGNINYGSSKYTGGLLGFSGVYSTIVNCYVTGNAYGVTGDFIGSLGALSSVKNNYHIGLVESSKVKNAFVGEFRVPAGAPPTDCYYDSITTASIDTLATGESTAKLTQQDTYANWDFDSTWIMVEGKTYPGLQSLNNAPFAFRDTFEAGRSIALQKMLWNDYDIETGSEKLVAKGEEVRGYGYYDKDWFYFPDTVTAGHTDTLIYRVGEKLPNGDTLWGGHALAFITKKEVQTDLLAGEIITSAKNTENQVIKSWIYNDGEATEDTFQVQLIFMGDTATETCNDSIAVGDSLLYIFNHTPDFTVEGIHALRVQLQEDDHPVNNHSVKMVNTYRGLNALAFDGHDDVVVFQDNDNIDLTDNYTLEARVKIDALKFSGIISKYHTSASNGYFLRLKHTSPHNQFEFDQVEGGPVLDTGRWYHVAAVKDGASRRLYVDGVEYALSGTAITVVANNDELRIGEDFHADNNRYFNGLIDEVRIWDTVRTAQQIFDNMHNEIEPAQNHLVAYYTFNQGQHNANNTLIDSLTDETSGNMHGEMVNFSLEAGADSSNFIKSAYKVQYLADENGSIIGDTAQVLRPGMDASPVNAVADVHYYFSGWDDGIETTNRQDTNVRNDIKVTACFRIDTLVLQYAAGANGSLSGEAYQVVDYGANGTAVHAIPNTGYHFVDWSDGDTTNPRIDSNIIADVTVEAGFEVITEIFVTESNAIEIYPNPATGFIYVLAFDKGIYNVKLIDVTGHMVLSRKMELPGKIQLHGISKGVYLIKISNGDRVFQEKVIIQ